MDRLVLVVVVTVIGVAWVAMLVGGIASGALFSWQILLAGVVPIVLTLTIVAACRHFAVNERAQYFLFTVPLAACLLIASTHSLNHLPPGGLISSFFIIEAVLLIIAAVSWQIRTRQVESSIATPNTDAAGASKPEPRCR
ncbi:MAG: hypothetical protein WCC84_09325 [Candidatus Cybelea sp.]